MKILVTGGSGFIGTNLVTRLVELGHDVLSLDPAPARNPLNQKITVAVDPLDSTGLKKAVSEFQPHYIYHLGARTDLLGKSPDDYSSNTKGVEILIEAARISTQLKAIFFASSRLVCEIGYQPVSDTDYCPSTPYGESKVKGEQIVRSAELSVPWCIFRPTSIWGPWFDIPYKTFFLTVARGRYLHPGRLRVFKSFGFVGNSVEQLVKLLAVSPDVYDKKTFYLCDEDPLEVGAWADEIATEMNLPKPRRVPYIVLKMLALVGDTLKLSGLKNPPITSFRLDNLTTQMTMDSSFVTRFLGPQHCTRQDGIRITVEWMRRAGQI